MRRVEGEDMGAGERDATSAWLRLTGTYGLLDSFEHQARSQNSLYTYTLRESARRPTHSLYEEWRFGTNEWHFARYVKQEQGESSHNQTLAQGPV